MSASTRRGLDIARLCALYGAAEAVPDLKASTLALASIAVLLAKYTGANGKASPAAIERIKADVNAREYELRKHST